MNFTMIWTAPAVMALSLVSSQAIGAMDVDQVIAGVTKAYKAPGAMTVTSSMKIEFGGEQMEEGFGSRFDSKGNMELDLPNLEVIALDGYVYVTIEGVDAAYLKRPVGDGVARTLTDIFGAPEVVPWDVALRTQQDPGDWVGHMTYGLLQGATFTGVSEGENPTTGKPAVVLEVTSSTGSGNLYIDPNTMFVNAFNASFTMPNAPAEMQTSMVMTVETKAVEKLDPPIAFAPGDRKAASTIEELMPAQAPEPVAAGPAPDFTLSQLGGTDVTLSKLKGKIIVIDMWATWCPPCKKGLPLIQKFSDWAEANHPDEISVYAVNVWERGNDKAAIVEKVQSFWEQNKYTMPTLISYDDKITNDYKVGGIPVTVMIDAEGNVAARHSGYSPNLFEELKKEAEKLLGSGS